VRVETGGVVHGASRGGSAGGEYTTAEVPVETGRAVHGVSRRVSVSETAAAPEAESSAAGVRLETGRAVRSVSRSGLFEVADDGDLWHAASLVIATGGLSVPRIGATPFGYAVARQFGLRVVECRPALVPLTFGPDERARYGALAGVSVEVVARAGGRAFRDKMLFTHRGLSGPAVLQASSYWQAGEAVEIDLLPGIDLASVLREARHAGDRAQVRTLLARWLPKRLADRWFAVHGESKPAAALSDREIAQLTEALHCWRLTPAGTEGYEKAEVTAGGVDTAELSSKTMEARQVPGLYFVGEVVDVTGQLGGFNFQWAWASGFAAGQHA
jgi:predicted Rossmann fold flavoprotein